MKHHKIPKSSKHRKFKHYRSIDSDEDEEPPVDLDKRKRRKLLLKLERLKEQKGPRKMQAITKGIVDAQSEEPKRKTKRQPALLRIATTTDGDTSGSTRGLKPMPDVVEQAPYESEEQFLNRISRLSAQAKVEAKLEDRFGLDFCPVMQPQILSTKSGSRIGGKRARQREKREQERAEARRAKRRERDARRRSKTKRGSKSKETNDFENFRDDVQFGDVVMAPPPFSKRKIKF